MTEAVAQPAATAAQAPITPETPQAPPAPTARTVAEQILAWAEQHHLLDAMTLGAQGAATAPTDGTLFPQALQTINLLRNKQVAGVLYNEPESTVYVLTRKKLGERQIKSMPCWHTGITVKYLNYGHAQTGAAPQPPNTTAYAEVDGRYACGGSIHPARHPGAGTMGCLVKDNQGTLYGLSANHVSGLSNYADDGEKILAPGHSDILPHGRDPFTIGIHVKALSMTPGSPTNVDIAMNTDAAVFSIRNPDAVSSSQGGHYDTPATTTDPAGGMMVEKVGRTTGHTTGKLVGLSPTPQAVGYQMLAVGGNATVYFNNLMMVWGENNTLFSAPGDSGALVVTQDANGETHAVGMVIAGTNTGYSLILPIRPILEALDMTLVTDHHT